MVVEGKAVATFQKPQKNQSNFTLPLSSLIKLVQETPGHDMSFGKKKFYFQIQLISEHLPYPTLPLSPLKEERHLLQRHRHFPEVQGCPNFSIIFVEM